MFGQKENLRDLAGALGFEYREGLQAFFDLPPLLSMVGKEIQLFKNFEKRSDFLQNFPLGKLAHRLAPGAVVGVHTGYNAAIFPMPRTRHTKVTDYRSQMGSHAFVVLLFKEPLSLHLLIQSADTKTQRLLSRMVEKFTMPVPDNPELNALLAASAGNRKRLAEMLADPQVQDNLLELFRFAGPLRVTEEGIRLMRFGDISDAGFVQALLDRMAHAARAIETVERSIP
jgi:hypothetical protein